MKRSKHGLIIGVGGHVLAIDPGTGEELWRTKLKGGSIVTVRETAKRIYAGVTGELWCLDRASGEILWHNKLKGLGLGAVLFAEDVEAAAAAAVQEATARAAAAG